MDKNYEFFLEVNKLQDRSIRIESQMNEFWNEIRILSSKRLLLGRAKAQVDRKIRDMIIEHNQIEYVKAKNGGMPKNGNS